ncbi:MAG TPA: winged helix-turn-helix domain-containing protein [Pyrinomonadaceae bacterium]|nr:winged helix-turn-helix domain-containing protein [Pyrinomonadaceae bacterium]
MPHNVAYEFGSYRLDLNKRVLMRVGETILLAPKALEIPIVLVLRAGELVEKDELLRAVWPDTFVEESNLSQNIFTLRRALGDERVGAKSVEQLQGAGHYRHTTPSTISRVPLARDVTECRDLLSHQGSRFTKGWQTAGADTVLVEKINARAITITGNG